MGICALFYIYRSVIRCAKFGVAVFKESMLDCKGVNLPWVYALFGIYRSAKFGVAVFKASMLDCKGINLPWVYMDCIYIYRSGIVYGVAVYHRHLCYD